ncbi:hypothetical protein KAR91_68835 [Candidatus Pacearchaeota archaeon]|nr:hypothetical protein [Candidatus Pacearchaeota archaeon]
MSRPVEDCRHCSKRFMAVTNGYTCFDKVYAVIFGEGLKKFKAMSRYKQLHYAENEEIYCKNYQERVLE